MLGQVAVCAACLLLSPAALPADHPVPTRVLIVNSFGRDNSPQELFASNFRSELARITPTPLAFYDISLDGSRFDPVRDAHAFTQFMRERFVGVNPDLVVAFGPLANVFYAQYRDELFPETPLLAALAEERVMRGIKLGPRDASIPIRLNVVGIFEHILQVLPDTATIAIIIGNAPIERFWVSVVREETKPLAGRINFLYLNTLPLEDIEKQVAALPRHSAILFTQMLVDGAGVSRQQDQAFDAIRKVARAPVFGLYASQLGKGIVGGPLLYEPEAGARAAQVARAMLAGEALSANVRPVEFTGGSYDWRELERWNVSERLLPPGSTILFRERSLWEEYKWAIAAGVGVVILQSVLLVALLLQRARRRRAEDEALLLSGRILTAHEDEHRRLARELHDDVTPRLARLAIDAARTKRSDTVSSGKEADLSMHDELVRLSEDVHAFSYRLHPTVLDDLGLVDALHSESDRVASGQAINVEVKIGEVPETMPRDVALCLFRIAQEALRNIARHAHARSAKVSLKRRKEGLELTVVDDGVGFQTGAARDRPSLGHSSMRERVRQLGGDLEIRSAPGSGTTIVAWVPLAREVA